MAFVLYCVEDIFCKKIFYAACIYFVIYIVFLVNIRT